MTSLEYSDHAVIRMEQRSIPHQLVSDIIKNPDGRISQSCDKEIIYKKVRSRKDNLIAIIVVNRNYILTVMNYFEVR